MTISVLAAGGGIKMPGEDVLRPLGQMLGVFLWFVAAGLILAAMRAGVEVAHRFDDGEVTGPGIRRLIAIALGAIVTASAISWAGWLLI